MYFIPIYLIAVALGYLWGAGKKRTKVIEEIMERIKKDHPKVKLLWCKPCESFNVRSPENGKTKPKDDCLICGEKLEKPV